MIRERTMRAENRAGTVSKEFASGDLHSVTTVYTTSGSRRSLATTRDDGATWITYRDYRFNGSPLYQLRTYTPTHGRWLNRDPIGEVGGENLYAFVDNSPMQWNDSIGLIVSGETTRFYDISTVPSMRWGMRRYTLRFSADNSIRIVEGTVPLGV